MSFISTDMPRCSASKLRCTSVSATIRSTIDTFDCSSDAADDARASAAVGVDAGRGAEPRARLALDVVVDRELARP